MALAKAFSSMANSPVLISSNIAISAKGIDFGARTVSEIVSPTFSIRLGGMITNELLVPSSSVVVGSSPASFSFKISCNVFANT